MPKRRVMIEMRPAPAPFEAAILPEDELRDEALLRAAAAPAAGELPGVKLDPSFEPVAVPGAAFPQIPGALEMGFDAALDAPETETYLVRGEIDDEDPRIAKLVAAAIKERARPAAALGVDGDGAGKSQIVGVYADVAIQSCVICPGSPPLGTHQDVERLLAVNRLQQRGMTGRGVHVAIVDTGINLAHLRAQGKNPRFDAARSWVPRAGLTPGQLPVGHGTMCAFDVLIAAPQCTLLDVAVLLSNAPGGSVMEGLLSDAVRAYAHLRQHLLARRFRSLVVNNSWGMFHPTWDYPIGHPGNYSNNPNHPFNRIVTSLERAGADILFAAGNCGSDCPDGRCQGVTNTIYGANSHPKVLCVAGVDTQQKRVGYSTIGPGRLARMKPDLAGYTHFQGSNVYPADGGTSAATPVVAGVVAAIRTRRPYVPFNPQRSPEAIRALFIKTAIDRPPSGYDFEYGWGIVNGSRLADAALGTAADTEGAGEAVQTPAPATGPRFEIEPTKLLEAARPLEGQLADGTAGDKYAPSGALQPAEAKYQ